LRSRGRRRSDLQSILAGLLLALLAAMVALSLATHSPLDLGQEWGSSARIENASGIVGAYVSAALFGALGALGAWAVPVAIALWSANRLRRFSWKALARRCVLAAGFMTVVLGLVSLWTHDGAVKWAGGLGYWTGRLASTAFGDVGAHLFLWAVLLTLTFVVTDLPLRILAWLGAGLTSVATVLALGASRAAAAVGAAASGAARGAIEAARRARERAQSPGDVAPSGDDVMPIGDEEILEAPMPSAPLVVSRAREAEVGRDPSAPEPAEAAGSREAVGGLSAGTERDPSDYELPPLSFLEAPRVVQGGVREDEVLEASRTLQLALSHFGVVGTVSEVHPGPVITRYDFEPAAGVRVSQIISREDDIALALRCQNIRIVAPIPGKAAVGIEVPNKSPQVVYLKELLSQPGFADSRSKLLIALGKTVAGDPYYADLGTMPHLLIAGATGSGKSVCVNSIIMSLLYRLTAQDLKLLLIDPKRLELSGYNGIPHLLFPVVTDHKKAAGALRWVVTEMERRYKHLATVGVRDIGSYNSRVAADPEGNLERLPYLVIVVDELADLMVALPAEIEEPVTRLAQMARAVGIHLILATQRPSVDVITGLIKANFPSRIAFQVAAKVDSRTILDTNGAECLLGRGDMLFLPGGTPQPVRVHAAFVSPEEIAGVTEFLKNQVSSEKEDVPDVQLDEGPWDDAAGDEEIFKEAAKLVVLHQQGSTSLLQRRLRIGYSRAARIVDMLEQRGIVGPFNGSKAREVLVDEEYLKEHSIS
jgi:S-DNA-T family DNA segregation ATPase FtsK/SpoIIIE